MASRQEFLEEIERLTQQIQLDPKNRALLRNRGETYVELGQSYVCNYRVFSDPTQVTEEVDCYSALKHFGDAIEDYQQALALAAEEENALFNKPLHESEYTRFCQAYMFRGDWYRRLRDHGSLRKNALQALEHIPDIGVGADFLPAFHSDMAYYHVICGLLYFVNQQYDEALASYTTAIEMSGFGYFERGFCYYQIGQYQKALHDLKTELSQCDEDFDPDRKFFIGWIEKCYQKLLETQSDTHEKRIEQVRLEEQQRVTSDLADFLKQRLSTAPAVQQEFSTSAMPQPEEVFSIDLGELKACLECRSNSSSLKKASYDLISAIVKIDKVGEIDPEAAIGKARKVTEIVICDLHVEKFGQRGKDLFGMIKTLHKEGIIPKKVHAYFEFVRKLGNLSVHYHPQNISEVTQNDVGFIGMITANIVQWYITETKPS